MIKIGRSSSFMHKTVNTFFHTLTAINVGNKWTASDAL